MIALYLNKHKYVFILYLISPSQTYPYNPRLVKVEMLDFIGKNARGNELHLIEEYFYNTGHSILQRTTNMIFKFRKT